LKRDSLFSDRGEWGIGVNHDLRMTYGERANPLGHNSVTSLSDYSSPGWRAWLDPDRHLWGPLGWSSSVAATRRLV
jgi:hypothetical protein